MALPNSGQISLGDMNTEVGRIPSTSIDMLEAPKLFNVTVGGLAKTTNIALTDFYGKSFTKNNFPLYFSSGSGADACNNANNTGANPITAYGYITDSATLQDGSQLFGNTTLTSYLASSRWYSDGTNYWYISANGILEGQTACTGGGGGGGGGGPTLYSITLDYGIRSNLVCTSPDTPGVTYYMSGSDWQTATILYTDSAGTTFATNGYYTGLGNDSIKYKRQSTGGSLGSATAC